MEYIQEAMNLIIMFIGIIAYISIGNICYWLVKNYTKDTGLESIRMNIVLMWPLFATVYSIGFIIFYIKGYIRGVEDSKKGE